MIALTTQSQWLISLCEIQASIQSPQRLAMEENQVDTARRLLSDTQRSKMKRAMEENMCGGLRGYPTKRAR